MEKKSNREALRKILLDKRDNTSFDLMKIASKEIQKKINNIRQYREAKKIAAYYPIGSEVLTQDIIQEALSEGKKIHLPKIIGKEIEFRQISNFNDLEIGSYGIMEPRQECLKSSSIDVILVPTVGISPVGVRLGYGHGFYDRFLAISKSVTIALTLEKQIIKNIPKEDHDIRIDWIVTEDRIIETSKHR